VTIGISKIRFNVGCRWPVADGRSQAAAAAAAAVAEAVAIKKMKD
jgi:hypothetical protein